MAGLTISGHDWADMALRPGVAAIVVAGCAATAWLVRWSMGAQVPTGSILRPLAITLIGVLALGGSTAVIAQPRIHQAQGNFLEGQGHWAGAISEYGAGNGQTTNDQELARTYNSWGQALAQKGNFEDAITKFHLVYQYPNATGEVSKAEMGEISAQFMLAQQDLAAESFPDATARLAQIKALSYCLSDCSHQVDVLSAQAYFDEAESALAGKNYVDAVTNFDIVLNKYSGSAQAPRVHNDLAQALLNLGQSVRATSCSGALTYYQRLAKEFGDTPPGQQAKSDLSAPQDVKGHISNSDSTHPLSLVALAQGLSGNMTSAQVLPAWNAARIKTSILESGDFVFKQVPQGTYDLMWFGTNGSEIYGAFTFDLNSKIPFNVASVGPLCPVDLGRPRPVKWCMSNHRVTHAFSSPRGVPASPPRR
jgi:hypothetical protein